jgi:hypothetical protein
MFPFVSSSSRAFFNYPFYQSNIRRHDVCYGNGYPDSFRIYERKIFRQHYEAHSGPISIGKTGLLGEKKKLI